MTHDELKILDDISILLEAIVLNFQHDPERKAFDLQTSVALLEGDAHFVRLRFQGVEKFRHKPGTQKGYRQPLRQFSGKTAVGTVVIEYIKLHKRRYANVFDCDLGRSYGALLLRYGDVSANVRVGRYIDERTYEDVDTSEQFSRWMPFEDKTPT